MKQIIIVLFIIFFSKSTLAQSFTNHEFVGTLQLSSGELLTFKLNFKRFPDNHIEGYSLTDIYGSDRTKSAIKGSYDTVSGRISFYETVNVSTKSDAGESEFCYIKASNIKVKTAKNKQIIQGAFTGSFSNGNKCTSGQLYLVTSEFLHKVADEYLNKAAAKNKDTAVLSKKFNDLKTKTENYELTVASKLNLKWKSKELILEIWDGGSEDLDEVEVYLNNRKVIDRVTIRLQKKVFVVPFEEQVGEIRIVGVSEGKSAPCTMNLILKDGDESTPLVAKLKKDESVSIILKR